ncbi:predicted protein [Nematostella vectensis]|uniref:WSC domain-containing protein n=1 Tax=Nematostella vectensis TaxID=45351 RepID=A7RYS0_NEMVE|nr:predicted protein [Nematostella vectensis]|eukprot:XP_001635475.1 predicted protein [Nematostella vectensis]
MSVLRVFIFSLSTICFCLCTSQALQNYTPVGCFKDQPYPNRALPSLLANFRIHHPIVNWFNLKTTVHECAKEAAKKGMVYFGVQFYGECWSGADAHKTYDKHGQSSQCKSGVGKHYTNYIYRFTGEENECLAPIALNNGDRSMSAGSGYLCDKNMVEAWYRFLPPAGSAMPTSCVPTSHCGTVIPGWIKPETHPSNPRQGIVDGTLTSLPFIRYLVPGKIENIDTLGIIGETVIQKKHGKREIHVAL